VFGGHDDERRWRADRAAGLQVAECLIGGWMTWQSGVERVLYARHLSVPATCRSALRAGLTAPVRRS